ncbi:MULTISPECIES: TetR/AcrR family transcriptional regulator [Streptomyces]|nr:TetR/AcrR family transcriptional regulator [Streptomyces sp. ET3-23]GHF43270.1 putative transcriptional regulator, TetR family protein [Streptomyces morookaense]
MKTNAEQEDTALSTRERVVRAASRLMQRQGYDGTGIKQIAQEAGATLGSVYHFFPGGKQELAVAAVHYGDVEFADILREVLYSDEDPAQAVVTCTQVLAEGLRASDWADGCPVTATALGSAGRAPDIQRAAADAFANWRDIVAQALHRAGIGEADARDLGWTVINTLEGAEFAAQAAQSDEPLRIAGEHLARLIGSYRAA